MSETPRTDAMQIFLWQHDETGRTCWMKTSPGPRWNRVGVPALCLLDDARQLERELTAERERADRLMRLAYLAGWNASGEGYNAEYPFGDSDMDPEADAKWIAVRDTALDAARRK